MKFTSVRLDQRTNALKLKGMTLDALQDLCSSIVEKEHACRNDIRRLQRPRAAKRQQTGLA